MILNECVTAIRTFNILYNASVQYFCRGLLILRYVYSSNNISHFVFLYLLRISKIIVVLIAILRGWVGGWVAGWLGG